jgi:hypothetical protein
MKLQFLVLAIFVHHIGTMSMEKSEAEDMDADVENLTIVYVRGPPGRPGPPGVIGMPGLPGRL